MQTNLPETYTKKRLLVFSGDPGGADCLVPVVKALAEICECIVMSRGSAIPLFRRVGIAVAEADDRVIDAVDVMGRTVEIDGILTSASSLPEKDMTEKLLWRWAGRKNVPSIAVLDQWDNYAPRFSGAHGCDRLSYLPDVVCVMDDLAKAEMVAEGFPEGILYVTGHPALEMVAGALAKIRSALSRERAGSEDGKAHITFFSQPIRDFYGDRLGYNECSVLNDIMRASALIARERKTVLTLVCKLHPKNSMDDFSAADRPGCIDLVFVKDERSNEELIASSDIVIGMSSVMMVHSILAGVPTICFEPGPGSAKCDSMPVRIGAIPRIMEKDALTALMTRLRSDRAFRLDYCGRQAVCKAHRGAVDNIVSLVCRTLDILPLGQSEREAAA